MPCECGRGEVKPNWFRKEDDVRLGFSKDVGRRALVATAAATLAVAGAASSARAAADRLPDLGMARLADFKLDKLSNGTRVLRYSTTIVNVGAGPFQVLGSRASFGDTQMSVTQQIYDDAGGVREVPTTADMFYAGDGHDHWHVRDLESTELIRLDNGVKVGTGAKRGFCFFDNFAYRLTLPGAPQRAAYTGCGHDTSLQVVTGLSVGWGDIYAWSLPNQFIDISGVSPGRYRLLVTADGGAWFAESDESNNATWVDLQLKHSGQPRVIAYGPAA